MIFEFPDKKVYNNKPNWKIHVEYIKGWNACHDAFMKVIESQPALVPFDRIVMLNKMTDICNRRYEDLKRKGSSSERIGMDEFLKPVFDEGIRFLLWWEDVLV